MMSEPPKTYIHSMKSGIRATPEFAKKRLAEYAVNVGLKCGHDCTYCSSGALLRCHAAFKEFGENPFRFGYSIVDPDLPDKVARDARRIRRRGIVQLCTTVDAWSPAAQQFDLGRRCLEALLGEPGWIVRILTKNAAVVGDFDVICKYKTRVLVGMSLTGNADKEDVIAAIEPNASPVSDRLAALREAHRMGLRTYGMLCPMLPGITDAPGQIDQLVQFVREIGAEEVFAEPVNARGPGLKNTEDALRANGFRAEAEAIARIRSRHNWSPYTADLVQNVQRAVRDHMTIEQLRFLLYPSNVTAQDLARIRIDDAGVIWLG